jgi:hypothetical protein
LLGSDVNTSQEVTSKRETTLFARQRRPLVVAGAEIAAVQYRRERLGMDEDVIDTGQIAVRKIIGHAVKQPIVVQPAISSRFRRAASRNSGSNFDISTNPG